MLTPFLDAQMFGQVYLVSLISLSFYWEEHWKRKVSKKELPYLREKLRRPEKPWENNSKTLWYSAYTLYSQWPGASILITRTTSTKLICFRQKFQESLKTAEHPLHQSIRLGLLGIHIALSDHNLISMSKSSRFRVIVWQSLFYPYFEINIEQDKIRCQSLVNQARNWKNWMIMLLFC